MAARAADAVVADCDGLDASSDKALAAPDLFTPGLLKMGAFQGAASLAAPNPLLVHNTGDKFATDWLRDVYAAANASQALRVEKDRLDDKAVADWIAQLKSGATPGVRK